MKKYLYLLGIVALAFSCSYEAEQEVVPTVQDLAPATIPVNDINKAISNSLRQTDEFNWSSLESNYISSAANAFDSTITVGYQPAGFQNLDSRMAAIDVNSKEWVEARKAVIGQIQNVYNDLGINEDVEEKITRIHETLPYFHIQTTEVEVVDRLRSSEYSRYVEPRSYEFEMVSENGANNHRELSDSGCGEDDNPTINSEDYTLVAPGAKASWVYYEHNIPNAWNYSTGDNIGVGLIDTGLSPNQVKLNGQFSSDYSTGRSVHKYGKFVDSWWPWSSTTDGPDDKCGHGTSMAGAIGAPRNNDGMAVGVAYRSDLYSVRAVEDVIISSGHEKDGVSDAYVLLGNKSNVKIISMSLGTPISSGQVADAIRYAYARGKLIFCAAGTSTSFTSWYGVIFPATMNETVAVTGIKDNGYNRCDVCHDGSKVDFAVEMERASTGKKSLTLPLRGYGTEYVGGSSIATAITAGSAALVWSRNPSWNRATVLGKLKAASDFYPSRNSDFGWGTIDVLQAVQN